MIIKCQTVGCESTFETDDPTAAEVKFICRIHTPVVKQDQHFQSIQFDKDLRRASKPQGTAHIPYQGSETMDSDQIRWLIKATNGPGEDDGE